MRSSSNPKDYYVLSAFEKVICCRIIFLSLFSFSVLRSYRYTVPDNRYIISCSTSQLGNIDILVPSGIRNSFRLSGQQPVNITGSTVTAYFNRNNQEYSVRWSTFGTAEYRLSTGSNTWFPLTITSINEGTTVQFLSALDTSELADVSILNICFLGVAIFICFLLLRHN